MRRVLFAAAFVLAAMPASAAHWTVDAAKSHLGFSVVWSKEPFTGVFRAWKADIEFDPADLAHSHVAVAVETGSEFSDSPDSDEGLKGTVGFAVDKFPTARFEADKFQRLADGSYLADAKLTIRGITQPLHVAFKLALDGKRAHMTGKATLDRTAFGVGQGEWAAPTPVAHEVTVSVDLTATKSGPAR
jgi:polyisoprenoid-binding protein YceI